jgi:hypothetical protein
MTTLGATTSKTLAKALFSWWTTSLPCSAASAGIVDVGALSGVAPRIDIVLNPIIIVAIWINRIGSKLDSNQHATFNGPVHPLCGLNRRANWEANRLTDGILSTGFSRICAQLA